MSAGGDRQGARIERVNGADLHVEVTGEGHETLLLIHGLMLASESFDAQRAHFERSYRVVSFDLRGQGRSAKTRDRLDLDALAEDAAEIARRFGRGPCHVVGFSMGAFIALRLAAREPALVRSLTLIGPSVEAESPWKMPVYAPLIALVRLLGVRPFVGALERILFGDTFLRDPARAAQRARLRSTLAALPRSLHRAAEASARRRASGHLLAQITMPTLVVSGDEDRPIPTRLARAVADGIAGARLEVFRATGHAVMIERPDAFNDLLAQFLRG